MEYESNKIDPQILNKIQDISERIKQIAHIMEIKSKYGQGRENK